jgi:hypothetical protein
VAQRFTLKVSMGPSKQEYQDLAKKSHMDDLQLEIVQLRDRVSAIQRNQDYAKEKSLVLQSAIETNNSRSTWISVFQVSCRALEVRVYCLPCLGVLTRWMAVRRSRCCCSRASTKPSTCSSSSARRSSCRLRH